VERDQEIENFKSKTSYRLDLELEIPFFNEETHKKDKKKLKIKPKFDNFGMKKHATAVSKKLKTQVLSVKSIDTEEKTVVKPYPMNTINF
jgi:DNA topoisomerase IA